MTTLEIVLVGALAVAAVVAVIAIYFLWEVMGALMGGLWK
jgi:hypothetical protein